MEVFTTKSEKVKHYIKESLVDGKEHTRSEIIDYVMKKSKCNSITEGVFAGSFNYLIRKNQIMIVKRGVYRLTQNAPSTNISSQTLMDESKTLEKLCVEILTKTITELHKTANSVNVLTLTNEKLQTIEKIKKAIASLEVDIKLFEEVIPVEN